LRFAGVMTNGALKPGILDLRPACAEPYKVGAARQAYLIAGLVLGKRGDQGWAISQHKPRVDLAGALGTG
jgi:hypothetical protein